jgi:hypothetical protein
LTDSKSGGHAFGDLAKELAGNCKLAVLQHRAVRQTGRAAEPAGLRRHRPHHVGSDFPFAPLPAREYFADNLDNYDGLYAAKLDAINHTNALSLFPRLARND